MKDLLNKWKLLRKSVEDYASSKISGAEREAILKEIETATGVKALQEKVLEAFRAGMHPLDYIVQVHDNPHVSYIPKGSIFPEGMSKVSELLDYDRYVKNFIKNTDNLKNAFLPESDVATVLAEILHRYGPYHGVTAQHIVDYVKSASLPLSDKRNRLFGLGKDLHELWPLSEDEKVQLLQSVRGDNVFSTIMHDPGLTPQDFINHIGILGNIAWDAINSRLEDGGDWGKTREDVNQHINNIYDAAIQKYDPYYLAKIAANSHQIPLEPALKLFHHLLKFTPGTDMGDGGNIKMPYTEQITNGLSRLMNVASVKDHLKSNPELFHHILFNRPDLQGDLARNFALNADQIDTILKHPQLSRSVISDIFNNSQSDIQDRHYHKLLSNPDFSHLINERMMGKMSDAVVQAYPDHSALRSEQVRRGFKDGSKEHIDFSFNSNKLRAARDFILEKFPDGVASKKELEKNGYIVRDLGLNYLLDPKGNIKASDVQKHIDSLPKHRYGISHGEWGHDSYEQAMADMESPPDHELVPDRWEHIDHDRATEHHEESFDPYHEKWRGIYEDNGAELTSDPLEDQREKISSDHIDAARNAHMEDFNLSDHEDCCFDQDAYDNAVDRAREDWSSNVEPDIDALNEASMDEQRHNWEPSRVFRLNATPEHIADMKKAGVYKDFQELHDSSHIHGHPAQPLVGLGWVRYTGHPAEGYHIDEIQSDFGQKLSKLISAESKYPYTTENLKKIHSILFNGKHPSEVIHEAFLQHLRNTGDAGKPVHIWQPDSKAEISGMSSHRDLPGYMQIGYDQVPKKLGYSPGKYGDIPTQNNPNLDGEPTWKQKLRKAIKDSSLRKSKIELLQKALSEVKTLMKAYGDVVSDPKNPNELQDVLNHIRTHFHPVDVGDSLAYLGNQVNKDEYPEQVLKDAISALRENSKLDTVWQRSTALSALSAKKTQDLWKLSPEDKEAIFSNGNKQRLLLDDPDILPDDIRNNIHRLSPNEITELDNRVRTAGWGDTPERKTEFLRDIYDEAIEKHPHIIPDLAASTVNLSQSAVQKAWDYVMQNDGGDDFSRDYLITNYGIPQHAIDFIIKNDPYHHHPLTHYHNLTHDQIDKILEHHQFEPNPQVMYNLFNTHANTLADRHWQWLFNRPDQVINVGPELMEKTPDHLLEEAAQSSNRSVAKRAQEALFASGRQDISTDHVNFALNTNRLRQIRDMALEAGGSLNVKELKRLNMNTKDLGIGHLVDKHGLIPAATLQQHIDNMPKMNFGISHTTYGKNYLDNEDLAVKRYDDEDEDDESDKYIKKRAYMKAIGEQRHTYEPSNVFQVSATPDHIKQMKEAGVHETFKKLHHESHRSGHPVAPHVGVGWVRWTGDPEKGIHIDEVQSDFGQSLVKKVRALADRAVAAGRMDADEADAYVANIAKDFPDSHLKKISDIIFGGKHPSEVIHEAFLQHLRDKGHYNTPIHIWDVKPKSQISLQDAEAELPGHMQIGYQQVPKKLGYTPGTYGEIPTQHNPEQQKKPTWKQKLRKSMDDILLKSIVKNGKGVVSVMPWGFVGEVVGKRVGDLIPIRHDLSSIGGSGVEIRNYPVNSIEPIDSKASRTQEPLDKKLTAAEKENAYNWDVGLAGRDARQELHDSMMRPHRKKDRKVMLSLLAQDTPTQIINGVKHYLLHRGMDDDEYNMLDAADIQAKSYTNDPEIARSFASQYGGHHLSYWIPETHISYSYNHAPHVGGNKNFNEAEGEVIALDDGSFQPHKHVDFTKDAHGLEENELEKAIHPKDIEKINNKTDLSLGEKVGHEFSNNIPELQSIIDDPKYIKGQKLEGASPKIYWKTAAGVPMMVKPYYRSGEPQWSKKDWPYPLHGWATIATKKMYDAGNIGHLCEDVSLGKIGDIPVTVHKFSTKHPRSESLSLNYQDVLDRAKIATMDFLTHNNDRHHHNILSQEDGSHPYAIDHERSLQYKNRTARRLYDHPNEYNRIGHPFSKVIGELHGWWTENAPQIYNTFKAELSKIKDQKLQDYLHDNFIARWDFLNRHAENYTDWFAPDERVAYIPMSSKGIVAPRFTKKAVMGKLDALNTIHQKMEWLDGKNEYMKPVKPHIARDIWENDIMPKVTAQDMINMVENEDHFNKFKFLPASIFGTVVRHLLDHATPDTVKQFLSHLDRRPEMKDRMSPFVLDNLHKIAYNKLRGK